MTDQVMTPTEFAQSIKAKYPDYATVPDDVLATKMLEKYPEYKDRVRTPDFKTTATVPGGVFGLKVTMPPDVAAQYKDLTSGKPQTGETWMDRLESWLPTIGGAAGGMIGGAGGAAFGMGVGGVPGAVGGAALGGMAGEAYKQLIRRARGLDTAPATSGEAAGSIATQGAIQGAAQGVGEAISPVAQALGGQIMQGAAKPGLKWTLRDAKAGVPMPKVVQTLLDEGINVTPGGLAKLKTLLDASNADIKAAVNGSTAQISPLKVGSRLNDTLKTFANQVNPQADLDTIREVGGNFINHPSMTGPTMSVADAQALKQGTYARIGEKYGQASAAGIEAEKAIARGLKEEIAAEVPDIAPLNAREGQLLEALSVVGKRVALAGNRDPIGFAWVAHNPTTFLAALIDRSPAVKSLLARGLYSMAGQVGNVPPQLIRVAVHSLAAEAPSGADSSSGQGRR